jgi:hypothetical protein
MYDGFSSERDESVPNFEYHGSHPGLVELRHRYNLDRVAGDGHPLARSRRLCDWLHRHVRHFDTAEQIELNSLSLLEYSYDNGREAGINCLMQATVLVEACLAVGLAARIVGLHPLSPYDMDQHYITVVWADSAAGWLMLDPSFGTCFKNADGTILSPWKLRRLFAEEAQVSCAPTDFGDDPQQAATDYREYIAKSIFCMQSPLTSGFGSAAGVGERWVTYAPREFDVRRREEIVAAWREKWARRLGWWDKSFATYNEQRKRTMQDGFVTSSLASFAAPPDHA